MFDLDKSLPLALVFRKFSLKFFCIQESTFLLKEVNQSLGNMVGATILSPSLWGKYVFHREVAHGGIWLGLLFCPFFLRKFFAPRKVVS